VTKAISFAPSLSLALSPGSAAFKSGCRILRGMDGDDLKIDQITPMGGPILE
jgi:hypothetical protein